MFIRTKVTLIQTAVVTATLAIILFMIYSSVSRLVMVKDDAIYNEKLDKVVTRIKSDHKSLIDTGLGDLEVYVQGTQQTLLASLAEQNYGGDNSDVTMFIVDGKGTVVLHPSLAAGSTELAREDFIRRSLDIRERKNLTGKVDGKDSWLLMDYFGPWDWHIGYVVTENFKFATINRFLRQLILISIVSILIMVIINFNTIKRLLSPLNTIVAVAEELGEGNMGVRMDIETTDETGQALRAIHNMAQQMVQVIDRLRMASDQVTSGSQQVNGVAQSMSSGANEQATAAEEASSSMEEMAANIRQNADNAQETEKIAVKAAQDAQEGGEAVQETVRAMSQIAEKISIIERSPGRPTSWPSTRPSRPRVPGSTAKGSPWWRPRSGSSPSAARRRRRRSASSPPPVWRWPRRPGTCSTSWSPTSGRPPSWSRRSQPLPASRPPGPTR